MVGAVVGAVLVHGLYHRPEHFDLVADGLRRLGLDVVVPALQQGSLLADTAVVQAAVDTFASPPLLLGHSYGGSVITGLRRVGQLLYVAAFVPAAGESAAGLGGSSPALRAAIRPGPGDATHLDPELALDVLYSDCPGDRAAWAAGLLRDQPSGHGRGVPRHHGWQHTPSTYVVCAQDQSIDPELQRAMAARCADVREWRTGHSPFVGRPESVIELVRELSC